MKAMGMTRCQNKLLTKKKRMLVQQGQRKDFTGD